MFAPASIQRLFLTALLVAGAPTTSTAAEPHWTQWLPDTAAVRAGPTTLGQSVEQLSTPPGESFPETAGFSQPLFGGPAGLQVGLELAWGFTPRLDLLVSFTSLLSTYSLEIGEQLLSASHHFRLAP